MNLLAFSDGDMPQALRGWASSPSTVGRSALSVAIEQKSIASGVLHVDNVNTGVQPTIAAAETLSLLDSFAWTG